jgi:nitrogen regulatory protein PII-like uncharacterized protein
MDTLATFAQDAKDAGVDGLCIFHYNGMSDDDFETLPTWTL